jgi:plasmid replication initiation protein
MKAKVCTDEALMLQRQIAMLETPSARVLTNLRQWLHGRSGTPSNKTRLDANDKHMFQDASDLVALKPAAERDIVSNFLRNHWFLPSKVRLAKTIPRALMNANSLPIATVFQPMDEDQILPGTATYLDRLGA